jgi:hypothetical protein
MVVLMDVLGERVRKVRDAPGASVSLSEEDSSGIVFSVVFGAVAAAGVEALFDGMMIFPHQIVPWCAWSATWSYQRRDRKIQARRLCRL